MSAGDYLDGWFESDPIKAVYGFDGIVGNYASPYSPGSAYVLLHHVFGEVNGKRGAWGHAIGGMGRDHAGHGALRRRPRRRRSASVRAVREVLVERRPRGRRGHRVGRDASRRRGRLQPQSEAAVRRSWSTRAALPPEFRERHRATGAAARAPSA